MPMRIDGTNQTQSIVPETANSTTSGGADFSQTFARTQKLQGQELEHFLSRVDEQGRKLAQSLTVRDLINFKDLIKSFLRSTFGQSRKMQEDNVWDYSGRPKVMARITKIDKALEDLGQQILDDHAKPLDILAKIDEIRGLIVDLFA